MNLFESYINSKNYELQRVTDAINNYKDIIGQLDSNLQDVKNKIITCLQHAEKYREQYELLNKLKDYEISIINSNYRVKFDEDIVFSILINEKKKQMFYNRSMTESEYWWMFFSYRNKLCSFCKRPIDRDSEKGGCICYKKHPSYCNKSYTPSYNNCYYADSNYVQTKLDLDS
jgi:hypothetical protein